MFGRSRWIVAMGATIVGSGAYMYTQGVLQAKGGYTPYPLERECTGTDCPVAQWDTNWDKMEPGEDEKRGHRHVRKHLILIRNGQYNVGAKNEEEKNLTAMGQAQIRAAATRLAALNLPYSIVVGSPSTRGVESTEIIVDVLKPINSGISDPLTEGFPVAPSPPVANLAGDHVYFRDVMRMEHAFRSIFRRPSCSLHADSYEVMVCPANTIRYFIRRSLQMPPQAWLRFQLPHGSISWITIDGVGNVSVHSIGDHGFLPPNTVSF